MFDLNFDNPVFRRNAVRRHAVKIPEEGLGAQCVQPMFEARGALLHLEGLPNVFAHIRHWLGSARTTIGNLDAAQALPILPMYASDKTDPAYPYHQPLAWNTNDSNPEANLTLHGQDISKSNNLNANVYLEIQPIRGLKYKSTFSLSPSSSSWRSWTPTYYLGPVNQALINSTSQNMSGGLGGWLFENTLNYQFSLRGVNNFNILGGMSAERWGLGELRL